VTATIGETRRGTTKRLMVMKDQQPTSRRVVTKVEWHPGEFYPNVDFIVTNLSRLPESIVAI
jgi:hypothetical protein